MTTRLRSRRLLLPWEWWLAAIAVAWPLGADIWSSGPREDSTLSNVVVSGVLIALVFAIGVWRTGHVRTSPRQVARSESSAIANLMALLLLGCLGVILTLFGTLGTAAFVGDIVHPPTNSEVADQVFHTGQAFLAIAPPSLVFGLLIVKKWLQLVRNELQLLKDEDCGSASQ